jgi:hypothetical protein
VGGYAAPSPTGAAKEVSVETVKEFVERTRGPVVPYLPSQYPWAYAHHYLRAELATVPDDLGLTGPQLSLEDAREVVQLWCALTGERIEDAGRMLADAYLERWGISNRPRAGAPVLDPRPAPDSEPARPEPARPEAYRPRADDTVHMDPPPSVWPEKLARPGRLTPRRRPRPGGRSWTATIRGVAAVPAELMSDAPMRDPAPLAGLLERTALLAMLPAAEEPAELPAIGQVSAV